ncbi:hypothetical protein PR202_gn00289 [Eleusine coracana subsp. coracana]|uniref:beta-ketoacyl-[acyl-carrier-protein] synthase I n=1 Tax=Eleusine coracana subsp. coracana TaxID=191504 RepID=A0AAV5G2P1_ELECO|nr:hypothetical protein PR202_gn00184 [Eleusine coracana subsp. coracana]GJN40973.1 hypothetical protein PR202_gn00289 [Eleusine coracana subsp. coracana]
MAAAVAPPLCTWLVAACLSAACSDEKEKQRRHAVGGLFGSRRHLGARRRGGARSGEAIFCFLLSRFPSCLLYCMAMAVALHPERGAVENMRFDVKQRRVVVTGMGVVTPLGHDPDEFYSNLLQGLSGISGIEAFDCSNYPTRIAGEIKSFSTDGWVAPKLAKRMDKFMQYLITAGKKALENAGITEDIMNELEKSRCGVLIGSAMGGMKVFSDAIEALRVSYKKMNPFCVPFATTNMGSAILAMDLGWMGPNYSISTACATSNFCILNAANHIRKGEADVMLCGGSDAPIIPIGLGGFVACRALSQRNSDPTKASRPWDVDRDGFVMGEGAGVLVLEELEHAKLRVNSTKSMTGHLLGAAGGIEAVAAIQAIRTGWVHPNINLDNPEKNVDVSMLVGPQKEKCDVKVTLSNSFGFGGHNSSILFAPLK